MCVHQLSVNWEGTLFDCDFHLASKLPVLGQDGAPRTVFDLESLADVESLPIRTVPYCFGCTAGAGSSCGGSLVGSTSE